MASLSRGKIIEKNAKLIDALTERGFGIRGGNSLILTPVEALYLIEKKKIEGLDSKKIMKFFGKRDKRLKEKFFVFRDLRERRFISRVGARDEYLRVYDRGVRPGEGKSRWLVRVLHDGEKFGAHEIDETVSIAGRVRKELILAVVSARGEILYYKIGRKQW